ncbi:hypothetical protein MesoLj131a_60640 [Mesorhizobium sp. 131-2-1]|nr:hypothetical protein MesoLj131a_60640 [Mesorhizobium sp. 131-2-1]BCH04272.1 hypothetical protein MesoLj131b_62710 [Mesorhizobium sp. 131-2-5]
MARGGKAGHGFYLRGNAPHLWDHTSQRVVVWIFRKEAINVGKQNENIGVSNLRDPCGQPIIVAQTGLRRSGRVVLVDNGHGANFEELLKG